jgi:hypothetical protein
LWIHNLSFHLNWDAMPILVDVEDALCRIFFDAEVSAGRT